ncbi:hypothetical protein AAHE18_02G027400 [Arachis hypogaea]
MILRFITLISSSTRITKGERFNYFHQYACSSLTRRFHRKLKLIQKVIFTNMHMLFCGTELCDGAFKAEIVAARWRNRAAFRRRRREMDGGEGVRSMTERGRRSSRVMGGMCLRLAVVWS